MENEEFGPSSLDEFVYAVASSSIDGGIVLHSTVVFSYLTTDGKIAYGVLHHGSSSKEMAVGTVIGAGRVFLEEYGDDR